VGQHYDNEFAFAEGELIVHFHDSSVNKRKSSLVVLQSHFSQRNVLTYRSLEVSAR